MKKAILGAAMLALAGSGAASAQTVKEAWAQGIEEANFGWAKAPYAILKIQDAAYLGEGESATLTGKAGKPESYRWASGQAKGVLTVRFEKGHARIVKDGQRLGENALFHGITIDKDVEIIAQPTQVAAGVMGIRVMVFNQQAKAAKTFTGVQYFNYDPAFRVSAVFKPDPKLPSRIFRTSRGTEKEFFHAGDALFTLGGKRVKLPLYTGARDGIDSLSAFFTDALSGLKTYGAGRYVETEGFGAFPPKTVTIDFNFAYNPNCVLSPFFTCPVATDHVDLAVTAGERDPHTKH